MAAPFLARLTETPPYGVQYLLFDGSTFSVVTFADDPGAQAYAAAKGAPVVPLAFAPTAAKVGKVTRIKRPKGAA